MVKQFTIPCEFQGGQTSPVTLYIGHPESTHHPVHFQSDWLSSAKGGTIPQDLMDTLQKLHDLANENGADFEELCYYALISATQHGVGSGVSQEDINKYADEYIKQEGNVDMGTEQTDAQMSGTDNEQTASTTAGDATTEQSPTNNTNTMKEAEQILTQAPVEEDKKETEDIKQITPTINAMGNDTQNSNGDTQTNTAGSGGINNTPASDGIDTAYSNEDEDLLLADDF